MIRGRRNILGILFFIYFLFYVLSPLCYAEDGLKKSDGGYAITYAAKYGTKNIHVIWEFVLSTLFQKENRENNNSGVQLIIKKDRAVLGSNGIVKIVQPELTETKCNALIYTYEGLSTPAVQLPDYDCRNGFYRLSSGLSPPRV